MINKINISYKQTIAIIYAVALFLDRLDLTIVNITLPTIAKEFKIPIIATDWISVAFLIALAMSIPISSWLGERFGLKKIFVISLLLFGVGSTLCALAPNLYVLTALRFIQGIGGGMLIPVGMTLIYRVYDPDEYASITSYTFIPSLIAPAIAPLLGGVLLTLIGWRFVFFFSGPICLVLAALAILLLKECEHKYKKPFDLFGFIASSLLLIDLFITLSIFSQTGLTWFSATGTLLTLPLLLIFIKCERISKNPLINLRYFKNKTFVKVNLIQLCFQACHFGAIFLIGMYLQIGIGFSAIYAGLIMGMQAFGAMATSRYSVKLFNDKSERFPIIVGLIGIAFITPCTLFISTTHMLVFGLILFFMRGIFSGLCGAPIQTLSVISFNKKEISTVNSIFNACRQVSISLGVAISSMLIAFGMRKGGMLHHSAIPPHEAINIFQYGFIAISVISIIGTTVAWSLKPGSTVISAK